MKIGIITHYDVHNHGAILQLNALTAILKQSGHQAQALQFEKNYDFLGVAMKSKYNIGIKSIPYYIRYTLKNGIARTLFNIRKRSLLERFKADNQLLGDYYSEAKDTDAVIIGSDEVFALHTGPTPVFFGHACPAEKVFAYAASFGPTTIEDIESLHCRQFVTSGLNGMCGLSVRDINSCDIAEQLLGHRPEIVADPVILYGYKDEIRTQQAPKLPPYMLVYAYDNNMNESSEVDCIKAYARTHKLKIVSAGFYHKWADYNINVSPTELLNYFHHAQCVVTDTFHGSVMSIITNRPLAVKIRGNGNKLRYLLSEYGLSGRELTAWDSLPEVLAKPIDYEAVNLEVVKRREKSMSYLTKMLSAN